MVFGRTRAPTSTTWKTLEDLNRDLRNLRSNELFELFVQTHTGYDPYANKEAYNSCGGTAAVIIRYFNDAGSFGYQLGFSQNQKLLTSNNNNAVLQKFLAFDGPWICQMEIPEGDHVFVIVHTGDHWGFFQSNHGTSANSFSVLPQLNIQRGIYRHYNRPYMNRTEFCNFFRELTKSGNSKTLFWENRNITKWAYAVARFDGTMMR